MTEEVKKITLGFILSWVLGIVAVISGVTYLFKAPGTGILFLFLAFILLPPANKLVREKLKFSISGGLKFIFFIVLLVIIATTMDKGNSSTTLTQKIDTKPTETQEKVDNKIDSKPAKIQEENIIKISAGDLYQEYKDNSVAADQKYDGKKVEVTGAIDDFGIDIMSRPYITFGFLETQAVFSKSYANQLAEFQKGQEIIVQCKVSGAPLGYPILDNCQIK